MWDGLLRSSKWRCTKADFSSYSETFMLDFLHVTPGWIIGYLSSPQGYEGSLIKLTSKQVRCLHHCFNAILNKLAGCVGTSFLFNLTRHRNSYFIRIIILWRQNNECDIWRKWWCSCVSSCSFVSSLLFQPVGFVTFDSRSGAEAAKNALNVSNGLFLQSSVFPLFNKTNRKWN